jgi:ankyrin repeat protein
MRFRTIKQRKFKAPKDGEMFLDYVATGRADLVEEYLDKGGNPKVKNCKGETALHIAVAHHQNDILARLLPYFSEEEMDLRNMYGLPVYITAVKYGNEQGAELINKYFKSIKTKPYRFKNYSFKKSIKRAKNNNFKNLVNQISESNSNPVIYPNNQTKNIINLWSYIPKRQSFTNKSKFIPTYNNKNTKVLIMNNKKDKKRRTKKKSNYYITQINKD